MVKETTKAYIAGILDGEGCLSCYPRDDHKIRIDIQISNTNLCMLEFVKKYYGGCLIRFKKRSKRHKQAYCLTLNSNVAINMLKDVTPYLVVKKDKAKKLLKLGSLILSRAEVVRRRHKNRAKSGFLGGGSVLTKKEIMLRTKLLSEL